MRRSHSDCSNRSWQKGLRTRPRSLVAEVLKRDTVSRARFTSRIRHRVPVDGKPLEIQPHFHLAAIARNTRIHAHTLQAPTDQHPPHGTPPSCPNTSRQPPLRNADLIPWFRLVLDDCRRASKASLPGMQHDEPQPLPMFETSAVPSPLVTGAKEKIIGEDAVDCEAV